MITVISISLALAGLSPLLFLLFLSLGAVGIPRYHTACRKVTCVALSSQEASAGKPGIANGVKAEEETEAEVAAAGGSQQGAQSSPKGPAAGTRRRPRARIAPEEDSDADAGSQGSPGAPLSSAASSSSSDIGATCALWHINKAVVAHVFAA